MPRRHRLVCVRFEPIPPDDAKIPSLAVLLGAFREVRLFEGPLRLTILRADRDRDLVPPELLERADVETYVHDVDVDDVEITPQK
jgi:hypothetical protein